jgi:hypothetical protein
VPGLPSFTPTRGICNAKKKTSSPLHILFSSASHPLIYSSSTHHLPLLHPSLSFSVPLTKNISIMDFSSMPTQSNSIFGNSTFTHNTNSSPSQGPPERNKEKLFRSWHEKQGIPAPQDYSLFAAQSAPFSIVRQNPNQPSALSPYLNQMLTHQSMHNMNSGLSSVSLTPRKWI